MPTSASLIIAGSKFIPALFSTVCYCFIFAPHTPTQCFGVNWAYWKPWIFLIVLGVTLSNTAQHVWYALKNCLMAGMRIVGKPKYKCILVSLTRYTQYSCGYFGGKEAYNLMLHFFPSPDLRYNRIFLLSGKHSRTGIYMVNILYMLISEGKLVYPDLLKFKGSKDSMLC